MNKRNRQYSNTNGRYLGKNEMQQYLNLGRNSVEKIGKAAGATVRIGSRVLYDREKIDAYLERLAQEQAAL